MKSAFAQHIQVCVNVLYAVVILLAQGRTRTW